MMRNIVTPDYDSRIRRAHRLATLQTSAKPALLFYACLAEFQKGLYVQLNSAPLSETRPLGDDFRSELDLASLLQLFPEFLSMVHRHGPEPAAQMARQTALEGPATWISLLTEYWTVAGRPAEAGALFSRETAAGSDALAEFIARAFLQPYAEFLSHRRHNPGPMESAPECPVCASGPMLVVIRNTERELLCSLCLHEWKAGVERCIHCGDEQDAKVSRHFFDGMAHVSLEACDRCRIYLPCIDLSKEREAIPEVDDIGAVELRRWAHERGYRRACANILGT
jgi:FdhE protein